MDFGKCQVLFYRFNRSKIIKCY